MDASVACAGGGMLGLTSLKPGSDGRWTLAQISCHSGRFLQFFPDLGRPLCLKKKKTDFNASSAPPLSSDHVTDLAFSPFDGSLLATCSADETVSALVFFLHTLLVLPPPRPCCSWQGAAGPLVLEVSLLSARRWRSWRESAERSARRFQTQQLASPEGPV